MGAKIWVLRVGWKFLILCNFYSKFAGNVFTKKFIQICGIERLAIFLDLLSNSSWIYNKRMERSNSYKFWGFRRLANFSNSLSNFVKILENFNKKIKGTILVPKCNHPYNLPCPKKRRRRKTNRQMQQAKWRFAFVDIVWMHIGCASLIISFFLIQSSFFSLHFIWMPSMEIFAIIEEW